MIKLLLLLLFITPLFAQCPEENNAVTELTDSIARISEKSACESKKEVNVADMALGCLSGSGGAAVGMVEGFISLLKLLVVDAPSYLFKESKEQILKILNSDTNPMEMASAIASINLSSQTSLWDKAKEYYESFKQFAGELKKELMTEIKGFPCLPVRQQAEIVCKGVTNVFLLVFGPEKFLQGAKWTMTTAKALKNFVAETKAVQGLGDLTIAERLQKASAALREGSGKGTEIMKLRNSTLTEITLPNGEKILQYEQRVRGADGKFQVVKREVPLDAKTGSIDSNTALGKQILGEVVQAKGGSGSMVFIDVNHLGKVNFYKGGTQTGDKYLESVAEALRMNMRPGDMLFKNGGDELVVILGTNNPTVVKQIFQRMINQVDQHREVRRIFREEVAALTQVYRDLNKAKKLDDLPVAFRERLTPGDTKEAGQNFDRFLSRKKQEVLSEMQEQATYRGSVSIGSTVVKHDETPSTPLFWTQS